MSTTQLLEELAQVPMKQDKQSPSMTMQEQARLSGLEFLDDSSLELQRSTTKEEYPPLR